MTIIFIENLQGSGKAIRIVEDFGDFVVRRELAPGDNACVDVARVKALHVEETVLPPRLRAVRTPPPALRVASRGLPTEPELELRYG